MNVNIAISIAVGCLVFSCGVYDYSVKKKVQTSGLSLVGESQFEQSSAGVSAAKLREYCRACHAVGNLRFIYDENDANLWNYILTQNVPLSSELWADAIVRVLSWPTEVAPAPVPLMDPSAGRDWMPKGSKRLHFAAESIEGVTLRQYILKAIDDDLAD